MIPILYFELAPRLAPRCQRPSRRLWFERNPFRRLRAKSFKSTLGIPNSRYGNGLDDPIAGLSDDPFVRGLRNNLPRSGSIPPMARSDDHVITFREKRDHLVEMDNIRRIVGITEKAQTAAGWTSLPYRVSLTPRWHDQ